MLNLTGTHFTYVNVIMSNCNFNVTFQLLSNAFYLFTPAHSFYVLHRGGDLKSSPFYPVKG